MEPAEPADGAPASASSAAPVLGAGRTVSEAPTRARRGGDPPRAVTRAARGKRVAVRSARSSGSDRAERTAVRHPPRHSSARLGLRSGHWRRDRSDRRYERQRTGTGGRRRRCAGTQDDRKGRRQQTGRGAARGAGHRGRPGRANPGHDATAGGAAGLGPRHPRFVGTQLSRRARGASRRVGAPDFRPVGGPTGLRAPWVDGHLAPTPSRHGPVSSPGMSGLVRLPGRPGVVPTGGRPAGMRTAAAAKHRPPRSDLEPDLRGPTSEPDLRGPTSRVRGGSGGKGRGQGAGAAAGRGRATSNRDPPRPDAVGELRRSGQFLNRRVRAGAGWGARTRWSRVARRWRAACGSSIPSPRERG